MEFWIDQKPGEGRSIQIFPANFKITVSFKGFLESIKVSPACKCYTLGKTHRKSSVSRSQASALSFHPPRLDPITFAWWISPGSMGPALGPRPLKWSSFVGVGVPMNPMHCHKWPHVILRRVQLDVLSSQHVASVRVRKTPGAFLSTWTLQKLWLLLWLTILPSDRYSNYSWRLPVMISTCKLASVLIWFTTLACILVE
jgi:hypothetical protein